MDDLVPQVDLEAEILRLSRQLDTATRKILVRARRCAQAESEYRRRYAREFLAVEGRNKEERDARVLSNPEIAELYDARKIAEAVLMSAQEAARNTRASLSALQSLNANQRFLLERG